MDQLKASCKIQADAAAAVAATSMPDAEELNFLLSSYGFISVLIMVLLCFLYSMRAITITIEFSKTLKSKLKM